MKGRLLIRLDSAPGAVAACEVFGTEGEVLRTAVASGDGTEVYLPAGAYLVRALLPTGELLRANAEVVADEVVTALLRPPPAAVELFDEGRPRAYAYLTRGLGEALGGPGRALWARLWSHFTSEWTGEVVRGEGAVEVRLEPGIGMYALQVGGPDTAWRMVCLPPSHQAVVTITPAPADGDFHDGVRVAAAGRYPRADAMLAYLMAGQLDQARVVAPDVVDQAQRLFQEKGMSPEGAAVAGYFLLRVGEQESLGDWPLNFTEWFPWLPDAGVIRAWQLLRRPDVPERDEARERLVRAAEAGVPRYTEGLRLLYEGLQLFAAEEPGDRRVAEAYADVRRYAAACDWSAACTTYWAERPAEPSLTRRTGMPADGGWESFTLE